MTTQAILSRLGQVVANARTVNVKALGVVTDDFEYLVSSTRHDSFVATKLSYNGDGFDLVGETHRGDGWRMESHYGIATFVLLKSGREEDTLVISLVRNLIGLEEFLSPY